MKLRNKCSDEGKGHCGALGGYCFCVCVCVCSNFKILDLIKSAHSAKLSGMLTSRGIKKRASHIIFCYYVLFHFVLFSLVFFFSAMYCFLLLRSVFDLLWPSHQRIKTEIPTRLSCQEEVVQCTILCIGPLLFGS